MTSPVRACVVRGTTASVLTGLGTIVTSIAAAADPLRPVSRAFPGDTPLTRPAGSIVATAGALDVHSISASDRGSPFDVLATATSVTPAPTATGAGSGAISSRATLCGLTRTVANPGLPLMTAPILTSPGRKNVALPVSSAAATSNGDPNQAVGFASIRFPSSSKPTAEKWMLSPTSTSTRGGVTSTRAGFGPTGAAGSCAIARDDTRNAQNNANAFS